MIVKTLYKTFNKPNLNRFHIWFLPNAVHTRISKN